MIKVNLHKRLYIYEYKRKTNHNSQGVNIKKSFFSGLYIEKRLFNSVLCMITLIHFDTLFLQSHNSAFIHAMHFVLS